MNEACFTQTIFASSEERIAPHGHALILDDEASVGQVLAGMLALCGFTVTCTQSAAEFFAQQQTTKPDLIIIDLFLPDRDGLDVLKELGSNCSSRIIVSSGAGPRLLETVRQAAEAYGMDVLGRLEKPFRLRDVRALVATIVPCAMRPMLRPTQAAAPSHGLDDLSQAMDAGEFCAHFQPQVSTVSNKPVGFECLVRWDHPTRGLLSPGIFLPWIEGAGLMERLTEIMMEHACRFMADWPERAFYVALNASVVICSKASFLAGLEKTLKQYGLGTERLVIEVTEAGDAGLSQVQIDQLTRIRMRGFHLSLDDFGTGQSSLERLVKIPFDELKIEKSFVDNCLANEEARQMICALVALAKAYGMSVVAEGVEDAATMNLMRDLGCDVVQGYFIARPLSAKDARAWLMRN